MESPAVGGIRREFQVWVATVPNRSIFQLEATLLPTSHQVRITVFVILPLICMGVVHARTLPHEHSHPPRALTSSRTSTHILPHEHSHTPTCAHKYGWHFILYLFTSYHDMFSKRVEWVRKYLLVVRYVLQQSSSDQRTCINGIKQ